MGPASGGARSPARDARAPVRRSWARGPAASGSRRAGRRTDLERGPGRRRRGCASCGGSTRGSRGLTARARTGVVGIAHQCRRAARLGSARLGASRRRPSGSGSTVPASGPSRPRSSSRRTSTATIATGRALVADGRAPRGERNGAPARAAHHSRACAGERQRRTAALSGAPSGDACGGRIRGAAHVAGGRCHGDGEVGGGVEVASYRFAG